MAGGAPLILSRAVTRLLTRDSQAGVSRGELSAIINLATRDGAISSDESSMLASLLRFREVQVEDVMTPRTVTVMAPVEATYVAGLDGRNLDLDDPAKFVEAHGLGFSDGKDFAGPGYVRFNFACPRSVVEEACDRLEGAVAAV